MSKFLQTSGSRFLLFHLLIVYILTKTEQKKCKNTQNILLDLCYLLLRSICKKNIWLYPEMLPRKRPKV